MRILWLTNILLPDICNELNHPIPVTGGWMGALLNALKVHYSEMQFGVATLYGAKKEFKKIQSNNVTYYCIPHAPFSHKYNPQLENIWEFINNDFKPDLTHIHGTEYPAGLAYIKVSPNIKIVTSIQGLISVICDTRFQFGGIDSKTRKKNRTIYDILKFIFKPIPSTLYKKRQEETYIKSVSNIIGRTEWDLAHTWAINPNIKYYSCNEILRSKFYTASKWNYNSCERFSIFLSQGYYPIKGLHMVLKALPYVLKKYPQTKLYISGINILENGIKRNWYAKYIRKLISRNNLTNHISFLGKLDEDEMIKKYQKAHVFICPSSIENSPNSLGEAQLIGTPTIGSYVGGIPNMIQHHQTGLLYRFEEYEMLAKYICDIFENSTLALHLSQNAITAAEARHNVHDISKKMFNIYNEIIER